MGAGHEGPEKVERVLRAVEPPSLSPLTFAPELAVTISTLRART